jgi:hypothetical protein
MTPLKGPPSKSLLFFVSRALHASPDVSVRYGEWAKEFGLVYRVPTFWSNSIALLDPKALAHFHARDTVTYVRNPMERRFIERLVRMNYYLHLHKKLYKNAVRSWFVMGRRGGSQTACLMDNLS